MIIQREEDLPDLSACRIITADTETTGLSPHHGDRICGIVISGGMNEQGYYLPIRHSPDSLSNSGPVEPGSVATPCLGFALPPAPHKNLDIQKVYNWLRPYAQNPDIVWVFQNAKFDLGMFRADGMEIAGGVFDTLVAAHVMRGDLFSYSLEALARVFLKEKALPWQAVLKTYLSLTQPNKQTPMGKSYINYSRIPLGIIAPYGLEDIGTTGRLAQYFINRDLKAATHNQGNLSWSQAELMAHEMKLARVIFEMEDKGVLVDIPRCIEFKQKAVDEIEQYSKRMYEIAGYEFNMGSYKQMWDAFEKVWMPPKYWNKPQRKLQKKYPQLTNREFAGKQKLDAFTEDKSKSTGRPCWNSMAILEYLKIARAEGNQKAFDFCLAFREIDVRKRLVSTFLEAYLKLTDPYWVIHGSFNQTGTVTGRLSSSEPNLQNVCKAKGTADQMAYEKFLGRKDEEALNRRIRELFIARPGRILVSQDWSQLEYRIAAYLAADESLKKAYLDNPRVDFHEMTARDTGIPRDQAKTVNFGILYGMMAFGLGSALSGFGFPTTKAQAQGYLNRVFNARPSIKHLIHDTQEIGSKLGYIQNPLGRICPIPPGRPYVALNYLDQGFGGDLMRYVLVRVHEFVKARQLPVDILLTVHDEIVYEIPEDRAHDIPPMIAEIMCECPFMDIPLCIDTEIGHSWGDQIDYSEWIAKFGKKDLAA
jgi:DNA polymerase-1